MSAWQSDGGETSARTIAIVAVVAILALVVGLAAGTFIGRSSTPQLATLADQARVLARGLVVELEPAGTDYAAGVTDGAVSDPVRYADAQARITTTKRRLAQDRVSLEALAPGAYARAVAAIDALATAAATPVPTTELAPLLEAALRELNALAGT